MEDISPSILPYSEREELSREILLLGLRGSGTEANLVCIPLLVHLRHLRLRPGGFLIQLLLYRCLLFARVKPGS